MVHFASQPLACPKHPKIACAFKQQSLAWSSPTLVWAGRACCIWFHLDTLFRAFNHILFSHWTWPLKCDRGQFYLWLVSASFDRQRLNFISSAVLSAASARLYYIHSLLMIRLGKGNIHSITSATFYPFRWSFSSISGWSGDPLYHFIIITDSSTEDETVWMRRSTP